MCAVCAAPVTTVGSRRWPSSAFCRCRCWERPFCALTALFFFQSFSFSPTLYSVFLSYISSYSRLLCTIKAYRKSASHECAQAYSHCTCIWINKWTHAKKLRGSLITIFGSQSLFLSLLLSVPSDFFFSSSHLQNLILPISCGAAVTRGYGENLSLSLSHTHTHTYECSPIHSHTIHLQSALETLPACACGHGGGC